MAYNLVLSDKADEQRRRWVRDALRAYHGSINADMKDGAEPKRLDVLLIDSQGQVMGGALGQVRWRWLYIDTLALAPSLRRQGWGSRMVRRAEAAAQQRGCTRSSLHTTDFQARPFYEKLGYRVVGELTDWLPGATEYWLIRELPAGMTEQPGPAAPGYELAVFDGADEERRKQAGRFLIDYNSAHNEYLRRAAARGHWEDPLDVYLLDAAGSPVAGLVGHVFGNGLEVRELWVAEPLRGLGWGRRLLETAEEEARRRNGAQAQVHIHSFQAPGFWEKLGYRRHGEIPDYPPGYAFSWLVKEL